MFKIMQIYYVQFYKLKTITKKDIKILYCF